MTIKDSGNRREFETGAVRDMEEGKGRYDLLPWEAIHELAIHCEEGAKKYGERNVEKGIPISSLVDSAIRHLSKYLQGYADEPHLRAAMWNVAFAIWMELERPEMQDIPNRRVRGRKYAAKMIAQWEAAIEAEAKDVGPRNSKVKVEVTGDRSDLLSMIETYITAQARLDGSSSFAILDELYYMLEVREDIENGQTHKERM